MRQRSCFVSNSSASSFIVLRVGDDYGPSNRIIGPRKVTTDKQDAALVKVGFRETLCVHPEELPFMDNNEFWKTEKELITKNKCIANYGYTVLCNQNKILRFLLKIDVPFVASCHYDDYCVLYKPERQTVYLFNNDDPLKLYNYNDFTSHVRVFSKKEFLDWIKEN